MIVQPDVCNGCAYCVSACPFGVIDRREDDGRAWKCTMCYDRLRGGLEPACAKACPTDSIQFGPLDELREIAQTRLEELHAGRRDARPGCTARTRRRRRRGRRVLPAAGRARGLRPAAGPGRDDQGPACHVAVGRRPPPRCWRRRGGGVRRAAPMNGRRHSDRAAAGAAGGVPVLLRPADPQGHRGGRSRTCRPTCSWASCPGRLAMVGAVGARDRPPRRWPGRPGSPRPPAPTAAARS